MKDFKVVLKFTAKGVQARCVKISKNERKNIDNEQKKK